MPDLVLSRRSSSRRGLGHTDVHDTMPGRTGGEVLATAELLFGDLDLAEQVARFCRDRTLILPVTRLTPDSSDQLIRSSMIGGFAALCPVVSLDSVVSAIEDRGPGDLAQACVEAAAAAYEFVQAEKEALAA